jgi:phage gpG-like protein
MIRMEIQLDGIAEVQGSLDRVQDVMRSFEPELRDIGEWYIDFLQNDVWETEGAVFNESWADLDPEYALAKSEKYPGRGILEASGKMRTSWKLYTTSRYALIENQMDYAIYHQEGTGKMPQRMMVKLDREREDKIMELFKEGVLKRIQNAFK